MKPHNHDAPTRCLVGGPRHGEFFEVEPNNVRSSVFVVSGTPQTAAHSSRWVIEPAQEVSTETYNLDLYALNGIYIQFYRYQFGYTAEQEEQLQRWINERYGK